jgi:hypothetical protein
MKVQKFFGIFDLNLGGIILGYFGFISNASLAILLIMDLLFDKEKSKSEAKEITENVQNFTPGLKIMESVEPISKTLSPEGWLSWMFDEFCRFLESFVASIAVVLTFVAVLCACSAISLIFVQGVNEVC